MRKWSIPALLPCLVAVLPLVGCEPRSGDVHTDDQRDPYAQVLPAAGEITLSAVSGFPCSVELVSSGVFLRASPEGTYPDPGLPVYLGPDNNYYAGARGQGGAIGVWSPTGVFLNSIGGSGSGPGEFESIPQPLVANGGTIYAYEVAGRRFHHFRPDGTLLSTVNASVGLTTYNEVVVVGRDSVLSGGGFGAAQFFLFNANGERINSFGEPSGGRSIAFVGDGRFWAAPPRADPRGYILEEWSLSGELLRRLERDVPWLPPSQSDSIPPSPMYKVYAGQNGHLVVVVWAHHPVQPGEAPDPDEWLEIIDPRVPEVIASAKIRSRGQAMHPVGRVVFAFASVTPGTNVGARLYADALDLFHVEPMQYRLVPQTSPADPRCSPT